MGSARPDNAGQCGLHYDALDNFHVLLSGYKRWKIYSPADALNLDYVLPVVNVSEDGDILQCVRACVRALFYCAMCHVHGWRRGRRIACACACRHAQSPRCFACCLRRHLPTRYEWDGDLKVFDLQTRFSKASTVHQGFTDVMRESHPRLMRGTQIEFDLEGGSALCVVVRFVSFRAICMALTFRGRACACACPRSEARMLRHGRAARVTSAVR
jgi:hypothetical protein